MKRLVLLSAFMAISAFLSYGQEVTGEIVGKVTLAEEDAPSRSDGHPDRTDLRRHDFVTTKEGNYRFWKSPLETTTSSSCSRE